MAGVASEVGLSWFRLLEIYVVDFRMFQLLNFAKLRIIKLVNTRIRKFENYLKYELSNSYFSPAIPLRSNPPVNQQNRVVPLLES